MKRRWGQHSSQFIKDIHLIPILGINNREPFIIRRHCQQRSIRRKSNFFHYRRHRNRLSLFPGLKIPDNNLSSYSRSYKIVIRTQRQRSSGSISLNISLRQIFFRVIHHNFPERIGYNKIACITSVAHCQCQRLFFQSLSFFFQFK